MSGDPVQWAGLIMVAAVLLTAAFVTIGILFTWFLDATRHPDPVPYPDSEEDEKR